MCAKLADKVNTSYINDVLQLINKTKKIDKNGNISFEGYALMDEEANISTYIDFAKNIPFDERKTILHQSLISILKQNSINKDALIAEISRTEDKYLNKPFADYIFISSISFKRTTFIKNFKINGCYINIHSNLQKNLKEKRAPIIEKAKGNIIINIPNNYQYIKCKTKARSASEAFRKSIYNIDLLRAIFNYIYNWKQFRMTFGPSTANPVNKIILGPIHTLHDKKGNLPGHDFYWYEENYIKGIEPLWLRGKETEKLIKNSRYVRKKINKHIYKDEIEDLFIRYVRALDDNDLNSSFNKLWSILEISTNTINQSYNETIKRVSFLYKKYRYATYKLDSLRRFRNLSIHKGEETPYLEVILYQLKDHVSDIIHYHLANRFKFKSIGHASTLLAKPNDVNLIEKEISILRKAQTMLS